MELKSFLTFADGGVSERLMEKITSAAPHVTPHDIVNQNFSMVVWYFRGEIEVWGDEGLPTHRGWGPLHWELAWQVSLESPSNL